ncbi:MAG: hypothetical protein AAGG48_18220 [Planctomycetota bacterium]
MSTRRLMLQVYSAWIGAEGSKETIQRLIAGFSETMSEGRRYLDEVDGQNRELAARYIDNVEHRLTQLQELDERGIDELLRTLQQEVDDDASQNQPSTKTSNQHQLLEILADVSKRLVLSLQLIKHELELEFEMSVQTVPSHIAALQSVSEKQKGALDALKGVSNATLPPIFGEVLRRLDSLYVDLDQHAITPLSETLLTTQRADVLSAYRTAMTTVDRCLQVATAIYDDIDIDVDLNSGETGTRIAELKKAYELKRAAESADAGKSEETVALGQFDAEVGPPAIVFVWDPGIVDEDDFADLFNAVGGLVRSHGGKGLKTLEEQQFGLSVEGVRR